MSPYCYVGNNPISRIDPDGNDGWDVIKGYAVATADNFTGGLVNLRGSVSYTDPADFNHGQDLGDASNIVMGADEAATGGSITTGAVVVTAGSGGTTAAVSVPAAFGGSLMAAHGTMMSVNATRNLASQKGRVQETRASSTRKEAKDARPKPDPAKPGQKQVTNRTRNKSGEGNKMKTDGGKQTPHFHDKNHNNPQKPNVHYRTTKKVKKT